LADEKDPGSPSAPTGKPKRSRPAASARGSTAASPSTQTAARRPTLAPAHAASAKKDAEVRAPAPPKEPRAPTPPSGTVVDATGLVLGRAASKIAKRLLQGESIIVVNAEKSVVTGSRENVLAFYVANRARGSKRTGPHYPRYPDRIFRRTVRGMLPHLKTRGKEALDRLEVYMGVPAELGPVARQSIEEAHPTPALRAPMTLEEITRLLGARL
jgi:large subunit ribosomal protein L13